MGWYNANNRCIGAVLIQPNGAIIDFTCPQDDTYRLNTGTAGIPTGVSVSTTYNTWSTFNIAGYVPTNINGVIANFSVSWNWSGTMWAYSTAQVTRTGEVLNLRENGTVASHTVGWIDFPRGASKQLDVMAFAQSTNGTAAFSIMGYRIER